MEVRPSETPIGIPIGADARAAVVIGGNDAVLAAYSLGIETPGETMKHQRDLRDHPPSACPKCYPSGTTSIRCHVVPGRWLTLYVMNALGIAYEWFGSCSAANCLVDAFYDRFYAEGR